MCRNLTIVCPKGFPDMRGTDDFDRGAKGGDPSEEPRYWGLTVILFFSHIFSLISFSIYTSVVSIIRDSAFILINVRCKIFNKDFLFFYSIFNLSHSHIGFCTYENIDIRQVFLSKAL